MLAVRSIGAPLDRIDGPVKVTGAARYDVGRIDVSWIEEDDPHVNPMGAKGIGEVGIVGTAAAIANAVHHATGMRIRELPIRLDKLIG
jgi:xanthine dehydrogenase YagR molybdenum-binding subunit